MQVHGSRHLRSLAIVSGQWPLVGLDVLPLKGAGSTEHAASTPAATPRLRHHRQCAWCLRLKHEDSRPHGHPWPRLADHSHGICSECKAELQAQRRVAA